MNTRPRIHRPTENLTMYQWHCAPYSKGQKPAIHITRHTLKKVTGEPAPFLVFFSGEFSGTRHHPVTGIAQPRMKEQTSPQRKDTPQLEIQEKEYSHPKAYAKATAALRHSKDCVHFPLINTAGPHDNKAGPAKTSAARKQVAGCRLNLFFIGFQIVDIKYTQLKRTGYQATARVDSSPFINRPERPVYKFILPFSQSILHRKAYLLRLVIISLV